MISGLFPGQGSQHVGMGKSFYDEFSTFRHTIDEASDALGFSLKKLCFDGPESDLVLTENAQPAILAVSTGCLRIAQEQLDVKLEMTLGHSLGEYSALVASNAIPFSQAVRWVRTRGQAMQQAVPLGEGSMAAVIGAEDELVKNWCVDATASAKQKRIENPDRKFSVDCTVEPANFNSPGQVVVSGSLDAIEALEALVATVIAEKTIRGLMIKRLNVSAPFHSSLMKPAREVMHQHLKGNTFGNLSIPYIPNRTARVNGEASIIADLLCEQIDHSVLWSQSMLALFERGSVLGFEFGPGKVLQGLAKRIAKSVGATFETVPIFDIESLRAAETILESKS